MRKPRVLDLFCKAGGAAMGYSRAGFEVVGVDIEPQPRYPFEFLQADALELVERRGREFDAIHASPPCQRYTVALNVAPERRDNHPDLVAPTREALIATGLPYVMENVPGAPMRDYIVLCGTMFGLRTPCGAELRRHRLFELNWDVGLVPECQHYASRSLSVSGHGQPQFHPSARTISVNGCGQASKRTISVTGSTPQKNIRRGRTITVVNNNRMPPNHGQVRETFPAAYARIAMGIDWMRRGELTQAIPPAYTEWLGRRLMEWLEAA